MKKQASLSILKVNNPFNTIAPSGSLLLCATDEGLKLYNENGEELQIGGGNIDLSNYTTEGPISLTSTANNITISGMSADIIASTVTIGDGRGTTTINGPFAINSEDGGSISINGATVNTANGLVQLNSDGKIPETLYNSGSFNGFTAEDISGSVISETIKTIKAGENIEFSEQEGVLTIKGTELESREDISFTVDTLNDGKLTVSECSIGSCCVMDNNGNLVMPDQQQSGSDVILNLSGYTITGTWKVKFIQGRTGGVTPEYAQQMATTYAIIFGS